MGIAFACATVVIAWLAVLTSLSVSLVSARERALVAVLARAGARNTGAHHGTWARRAAWTPPAYRPMRPAGREGRVP